MPELFVKHQEKIDSNKTSIRAKMQSEIKKKKLSEIL